MLKNYIDKRVNERLSELGLNTYIDEETGEVQQGLLATREQIEAQIREQETKKQQREYFKEKEERLSYIKTLGNGQGFYFSKYVELLKKINFDYALALRYFYLCAFADSDGYLKNGRQYLNEKELKTIYFNLSDNKIVAIKEQLIDFKLISVNDEAKIKVNENYFLRSSMTKDFKKECCRVFDYGIKEFYNQLNPREHKKAGKIIPLLEYMHYSNNILCSNPSEKDLNKIKPLTLKEIGEIINLDTSNYNRTVNYLLKITVDSKPLLAEVRKLDSRVIVVNPTIFYKGSNVEDIKWLKDFFELDI